MAVRTATRRWTDLGAFLHEYPQTLAVGALVLPAEALDGEPAPELKVDLILPLVGRVGPITAQVVAKLPGGAVALRIPSMPEKVAASMAEVFETVESVKAWLLASGAASPAGFIAPDSLRPLEARVRELEGLLSRAPQAAASGSSASAPAARARGLQVPDVSLREPALSGALGDRSLRDAFMALAVEKMTGLLTVVAGGRTRSGFWGKGGPVAWRTDPVDEQEVLGVLLFRAGTVTKEQLAESLAIMERTGCRQGEALIEMGVISFPQLVLMLQKQADFVLQRVLRDREGTWTFHVLDELPERFVAPPVRVASLMYRALLQHVREMPAQELAATLRPWLDQYLFLAPGVERTLEDMKLSPEERHFVKIVAATSYRLREVFSVSSLSRSQTAGAVWCLHELNLLELRTEGSDTRSNERVIRELKQRKGQSAGGTYFDRLDLHWICSGVDVETAHRKLSAEYRPERAAELGEEHRGSLEVIWKAVQDAHENLKGDARRREYRAKVIEKGKIEQSAEMLARKGEMAIMKGQSREALDCFAKAAELVPSSAEYREALARARTLPG